MSTPSEASLDRSSTRAVNRAEVIDRNFTDFVSAWDGDAAAGDLAAPLRPGDALTGAELIDIFKAQLRSRHMDLVAREMRARNEGFYTIGSCGHENNAVLGALTRTTDPAFLHYRSGGFMMARWAKDPDIDPLFDTALSLAASSDDPISRGRHKVWGSRKLWVLPQTSTIASHLPKAVGTAIALEQSRRLHIDPPVPSDSIVVCSFGDASANHSAALGAFNAAQWTAYQNLPVPILFVCEDNGLGISVRTPGGWIEANFQNRSSLHYIRANGLDTVATHRAATEALRICRGQRKPVLLHLSMVRLLAHAGTDMETENRKLTEIEADEANDPVLATAAAVLEAGLMTRSQVLDEYEAVRTAAREAAKRAALRPRLVSSDDVTASLAPYDTKAVNAEATRSDWQAQRESVFGGAERLPENQPPRHLAIQINRALKDLMIKYPQMTIFGEDVSTKGGVYTVTSGLSRTFKGNRVFNTLLDETTILGMAQGAAAMGLLPVPEIQYLAYFHNACDQVRGEAASLQFFSDDQFQNPMIIRIAALAYQKGFGGHFHNDNSITALRDIPGLIIACPSRGDDAVMMLRTCASIARACGRVVAFLEPIALYMTKDLYHERDGQWLFPYPPPGHAVLLGEGRVYNPRATDLLIITYGNGVPMSLRAARRLEAATKAQVRVLDLRWLKPLNTRLIARHAGTVGKVLVVDEGRRTGGVSEEIFTAIDEHASPGIFKRRITGEDTYIPLGPSANLVLPSEDDIFEAAAVML